MEKIFKNRAGFNLAYEYGWMKKMLLGLLCAMMLLLCSCNQAELEDRSYPQAIGIDWEDGSYTVTFVFPELSDKADQNSSEDTPSDFTVESADFYDALSTYENNVEHTLDCNHVIALIFGKGMMENETEMEQFLTYLEQDEVLARNVLVFQAQTKASEILALDGQLDSSIGEYLEGLMENQEVYKTDRIITIGTLLNQMYSRNETKLIPVLYEVEEIPMIGAYRVLQRFQVEGELDATQAMMAAMTQNQLKKFAFYIEGNLLAELTELSCTYEMQDMDGKPELTVSLKADARILNQRLEGLEQKTEMKSSLEEHLVELLQEAEDKSREQDIDMTNSFVKLGSYHRKLYIQYSENPEAYERDLTVHFIADITMTE